MLDPSTALTLILGLIDRVGVHGVNRLLRPALEVNFARIVGKAHPIPGQIWSIGQLVEHVGAAHGHQPPSVAEIGQVLGLESGCPLGPSERLAQSILPVERMSSSSASIALTRVSNFAAIERMPSRGPLSS